MENTTLPTDPVTGVSDAIISVSELIEDMSAKDHPLLYHWRIHILENKIIKEYKKNNKLIIADVVHSECHDLDKEEQKFIIHVHNGETWITELVFYHLNNKFK